MPGVSWFGCATHTADAHSVERESYGAAGRATSALLQRSIRAVRASPDGGTPTTERPTAR